MKIALLLSGGVDSSVALKLLKDQGHEVTAYYLKIWLEDELSYLTDCPWESDLEFARNVCEQFDVELKVVPFQKMYHDKVVAYTIDEVKNGRTPNPDMMCNSMIKFGAFLDQFGDQYDKIASGHYANVIEENGHYYLYQAPDPIKDQTYFLARLSQKQLSKVMFPIGNLQKSEVREIAHVADLANKDRKDSQGICFLGKFKYRDFIKNYLGEMPGDIIEFETGEKLGQHQGFYYYTIGQRKGIELSGGPWFVVKKDTKNNIIYISKNYHSEDKVRDSFYIEDLIKFEENFPVDNMKVKIRHGEAFHDCVVNQDNGKLQIELSESDQGIAAGQFAVFYKEGKCLASAVISQDGN